MKTSKLGYQRSVKKRSRENTKGIRLLQASAPMAGHLLPQNSTLLSLQYRKSAPAEFTIHGLWPDYNDGSWPLCYTGKKIYAKEVSTLLDSLNKYRSTSSCGSTSNCHGGKGLFWEHEWEKHGTYAAPVTGEEYNYFVTALNVYFKYNITEVLREAGYVTSNSEKYPLGGIVSAIQNAFHVTPELECSGDAVEELYLCFYKDFKPRDCAVKSNTGRVNAKTCPKYVSLRKYVSLKHANGEAEVLKFDF